MGVSAEENPNGNFRAEKAQQVEWEMFRVYVTAMAGKQQMNQRTRRLSQTLPCLKTHLLAGGQE